ncbi:MAG: hypothetical protein H6813_06235 [Phycisphaeraceae bacterium]|nr:hypothetical protein [Phycisphaeraceae bacterium]MCB9848069.1 hypothetical protein [Phycisphaeraceae bacterium]
MMNMLKWYVAGTVGGLLGAVVWALVYHYADFEVGWIAWGIGALAGLGVRAAAQNASGGGPGIAAVAAAVLCLLVGKFGGLYLDINEAIGQNGGDNSTEFLTSIIADDIVAQRLSSGQPMNWPADVDARYAAVREDYPRDVWTEARARLEAYSDEDRARFTETPSLLLGEEYVISWIADEQIAMREAAGETYHWPAGVEPYEGRWKKDYSADIWDDAVAIWDGMSESQRIAYRSQIDYDAHPSPLALSLAFFTDTLSIADLLWFGLAMVIAYKLAASDIED